jgi:hypothetical protein
MAPEPVLARAVPPVISSSLIGFCAAFLKAVVGLGSPTVLTRLSRYEPLPRTALIECWAHGLIEKIPKTHRYMVTDQGRKAITALLAARSVSTEQLINLAG